MWNSRIYMLEKSLLENDITPKMFHEELFVGNDPVLKREYERGRGMSVYDFINHPIPDYPDCPKTVQFCVYNSPLVSVGWTHNIINLSDTENLVTVMTCNEIFDPGHPDTFGEPV